MSAYTYTAGHATVDGKAMNISKVRRIVRCYLCGRMVRAGEYVTKHSNAGKTTRCVCRACRPFGDITNANGTKVKEK